LKLQLDREELAQRYRRQAADLTIQIASLLQGGILSAAAFSLIGIFQTPDDVAIRTMLWLISVVLGFVMFFRLCHRALLLMHPGADVLLMLPVLCLIEITLFAILAAGTLGPDGWRFWYFGGAALFATGAAANALNYRSLRAEHYAEDAQDIHATLRANIRRECIEGIAAAALTAALGVWLFMMGGDWSGAWVVVALHLLLTLVSGAMLIAQDSSEAAKFRAL
jgi:hypothetical protein